MGKKHVAIFVWGTVRLVTGATNALTRIPCSGVVLFYAPVCLYALVVLALELMHCRRSAVQAVERGKGGYEICLLRRVCGGGGKRVNAVIFVLPVVRCCVCVVERHHPGGSETMSAFVCTFLRKRPVGLLNQQ